MMLIKPVWITKVSHSCSMEYPTSTRTSHLCGTQNSEFNSVYFAMSVKVSRWPQTTPCWEQVSRDIPDRWK